jgi:hypothetical protein
VSPMPHLAGSRAEADAGSPRTSRSWREELISQSEWPSKGVLRGPQEETIQVTALLNNVDLLKLKLGYANSRAT